MGTQAGQFIPPARQTGTSQQSSEPALKPVVAGKPNPNIGMGLKTPDDQPQFGEFGWVNPNYDPYHNADGYHRFDPKIPGMGLQYSRTYADGAGIFNAYQGIAKGRPGYTHAQNALNFLSENGINPDRANDVQKFAAMDYAMRLVQWKNQRPKRKFTLKQAFGTLAQIGATIYGGPWGAAAGSAFNTALQGGDFGDIAKNAAISGALAWGGGVIGDKLGSLGTTSGNSVDAMFGAAANTGSTASTLANIGRGVSTAIGAAAPYLSTAGQVAGTLYDNVNRSGVNLSPDQYSLRQGGNPKITTFEPENQNIAYSQYPTSAYLGAYPSASALTARSASPITPTPVAPITGTANVTSNAARPYVAPTRIPIAANIPVINYDPSRNYPQTTTMQQALTRPGATRTSSKNARTA
jgi:hypothetical protein